MKFPLFAPSAWLALACAGFVVVSCGAEDAKKKAQPGAGGSGGQAGSGGTAGKGGSAAGGKSGSGDAGAPSAGGAAGETGAAGEGGAVGEAGAAGQGGEPGAAGAGGEGGGGPLFKGLYVGTTGSDTATGVHDDPYATLQHAASVAQSGDTIVFLDGTYAVDTGQVRTQIPAGVNLVAENFGQVQLNGLAGNLLELLGSTRIEGLIFQNYQGVIRALGSGTVEVVDSSFVNSGSAAGMIELAGTVAMTMTASPGHDWGNGIEFAFVHEGGSLTIQGGTLHDFNGSGTIFRVAENATLNLNDVDIVDGAQIPVTMSNQAKVNVDGATFTTLSPQLFIVQNQSELTIKNSDISIAPASPQRFECIRSELNGVGKIVVEDSSVHGCSSAFNSTLPGTFSLLRVEVYDNTFAGINLDFGVGGTVTVTDCDFHDNATMGMRWGGSGGGNYLINMKMRGTTVTNNPEGVRINGDPSSTWDFGKVGDPGGNSLQGSVTGLRSLVAAAVRVYAVGNAWVPNVQSADASGQYVAVGAGAVIDIVGPTADGLNYSVGYGSILRLAQNP